MYCWRHLLVEPKKTNAYTWYNDILKYLYTTENVLCLDLVIVIVDSIKGLKYLILFYFQYMSVSSVTKNTEGKIRYEGIWEMNVIKLENGLVQDVIGNLNINLIYQLIWELFVFLINHVCSITKNIQPNRNNCLFGSTT